MLMVNWREDVEFFYVLAMIVSLVIVFFNLYPSWGIPTAAATTAVIGVIEAIIGFAAFESERAVEKWSKLTKK
jgi:hypothetical protein